MSLAIVSRATDAVTVTAVRAAVYRIPTERPESDGTLAWDATTLVACWIEAGGATGFGYTYADPACAGLIRGRLAAAVRGLDALAVGEARRRMLAAIRNLGAEGIGAMAVAAVDNALWDLAAKLLGLPLARLFGLARGRVPVYGSGGFTSLDERALADQLGGWAAAGMRWVKMKVGRDPAADRGRVRAARDAIGPATGLMVDANGGYGRAQAVAMAAAFAELGVGWFEEPVPAHDVDGLVEVRRRLPPGMELSAGEYGWHERRFRRLLAAGAVDVLQADATRCAGLSGTLAAATLCEVFGVPLSTHCAPALHLPLACARPVIRHIEWFADHVRIERMLLDGAPEPREGTIAPDLDRPGVGVELKEADARRFLVEG